MQHAVLKSLAAAGTLALAIAACSSSGTQSGSGNAASSKTLVIESTSVTAPSQNFQPLRAERDRVLGPGDRADLRAALHLQRDEPHSQPVPMLASGQPTWSNGGKTLTVPIRSGVKWSDGKPFTASDVAFTYNLVKKNPTLYTASAPLVTSATATSPTSVTLNFSSAQFANLFLIGQVYIVPQHVWGSVSNPVTYTDANPVGTGPYMLQTYSSHGFLLKQNPSYWNKSTVKVTAVDFPFYSSNANLVPPIASGRSTGPAATWGPASARTT
jgi:ABC-type dipeptide transport system, periplasmic component